MRWPSPTGALEDRPSFPSLASVCRPNSGDGSTKGIPELLPIPPGRGTLKNPCICAPAYEFWNRPEKTRRR